MVLLYFIHSYDEKEIPLFLILSSYLSPNVTYILHVCESISFISFDDYKNTATGERFFFLSKTRISLVLVLRVLEYRIYIFHISWNAMLLLFFLLDSHATRARTATYVNVCPSRVVFFSVIIIMEYMTRRLVDFAPFLAHVIYFFFFALYAHIYSYYIIRSSSLMGLFSDWESICTKEEEESTY
jgi:multisubunit Na+/H+ antiporter MnhG subunit